MTIWRPVTNTYFLLALIVLASASQAGQLLELSVTESDDEYKVHIVALLDAPQHYVYRVITDYRHAYRINPAITSAEILPADRDGVTRVKNRSEHRVGLFSFEVEWAGDIVEAEPGHLDITTIPEISSFESGSALWEMRAQGENTWVLHESILKPKFSIFPIIGEYIMKKHMEEEILATFGRIECNAQIMLEADMGEPTDRLSALVKKTNCVSPTDYAANQEPNDQ